MITPQWLKLPMSRTNFYGPKEVQATEVQLYILQQKKKKKKKKKKIVREMPRKSHSHRIKPTNET